MASTNQPTSGTKNLENLDTEAAVEETEDVKPNDLEKDETTNSPSQREPEESSSPTAKENTEGDDDHQADEDEEDDIKVIIDDPEDVDVASIQKQSRQIKQSAPVVLEPTVVDINTLDEKPWRLPGADINDYFNYGFDETTWKLYCEKQKKQKNEVVEIINETFKIPVVGHQTYQPVQPVVLAPFVNEQHPPSSSTVTRSNRHEQREISGHKRSRSPQTRERERKHSSSRSRKRSKSRERRRSRSREAKKRRSRSREREEDRRSKRHKTSRRT